MCVAQNPHTGRQFLGVIRMIEKPFIEVFDDDDLNHIGDTENDYFDDDEEYEDDEEMGGFVDGYWPEDAA